MKEAVQKWVEDLADHLAVVAVHHLVDHMEVDPRVHLVEDSNLLEHLVRVAQMFGEVVHRHIVHKLLVEVRMALVLCLAVAMVVLDLVVDSVVAAEVDPGRKDLVEDNLAVGVVARAVEVLADHNVNLVDHRDPVK